MQPGQHQRLLSSLTAAAHDQGFAIPIWPAREIFRCLITRQIHPQKVTRVAIIVANRPVVLQRARELLLVERFGFVDRQIMRFNI